MKKFNLFLSIAIATISVLITSSCITPQGPTVNPAPPHMCVEATYQAQEDGGYLWTWSNKDYTYNSTNVWRGLEVHEQDAKNSSAHLRFYMIPNTDWEVEVAEGAEYLQILVGQDSYGGFDFNRYDHVSVMRGSRGYSLVRFFVEKTPAYGEEPVVCKVVIRMMQEEVPICIFTIEPSLTPEESNE